MDDTQNEIQEENKDSYKINTLVLSGGGVKGFAYIGVLKKLEELKKLKDLKHILGVSIGSVFGLLYLIGYTYEELYEEFLTKNIKDLTDYKISNFIKKYGFETGKIFITWLETLLLKKGISQRVTFNELYKKNGIKYSIVVTNLNYYRTEVFNYETKPKMKILKAIRMSINLPLIFTKQEYNNNIYVDGGVINNLPMNLVEEEFPNILGINLVYKNTKDEIGHTIDSVDKYMYHVCNCFLRFKSKIDNEYKDKIINIEILNIETFNWNINDNDKRYLVECGYNYTDNYFIEKNNI